MSEQLTEELLEIKDTSELMIDLAYSALLYQNDEIAREVLALEEKIDALNERIQRMAVEQAVEDKNIEKALILIRLATSIEAVADSAVDIADIVLRDIETHPVIAMSLQEADVTITKLNVNSGSELIGKKIGDSKVATKTGMWIIAIKRRNRWIYGPDENDIILEGDEIFARGPPEGVEKLRILCALPTAAQ